MQLSRLQEVHFGALPSNLPTLSAVLAPVSSHILHLPRLVLTETLHNEIEAGACALQATQPVLVSVMDSVSDADVECFKVTVSNPDTFCCKMLTCNNVACYANGKAPWSCHLSPV